MADDNFVKPSSNPGSGSVVVPAKPAIQSITVVSSIVGVINGADLLLGYLGIIPAGALPTLVNGAVAIIGSLLTWWGRVRARSVIKGVVSTV